MSEKNVFSFQLRWDLKPAEISELYCPEILSVKFINLLHIPQLSDNSNSLYVFVRLKKLKFEILSTNNPQLVQSNPNQNQSRKISICQQVDEGQQQSLILFRLLFPIASYSTSEGSQFREIFAVKAFQRRGKLKGIKYLNVTNTHSADNASTECRCNGNISNLLMENDAKVMEGQRD